MIRSTHSQFMRLLAIAMGALALCATIPSSAFADLSEISIKDTTGVVRGAANVEGEGVVEFTVTDASGAPASDVSVTLTNALTGETLTGTAVDGVVTFSGVTPGSWTVASAIPGLTFTNIAIGAVPGILAGGVGTGLIVAGVTGGAVATGIAISDSDNDDSDLSPSR